MERKLVEIAFDNCKLSIFVAIQSAVDKGVLSCPFPQSFQHFNTQIREILSTVNIKTYHDSIDFSVSTCTIEDLKKLLLNR